jgi:glycosyltransferase involved in cell wall biosynthesis
LEVHWFFPQANIGIFRNPMRAAHPLLPIPVIHGYFRGNGWREQKKEVGLSLTSIPLFSVIIPTTLRKKSLADTLRCLERQQFPRDRFEVLVVVNGNTEKAFEPLQAEFRHFPNLRFLFLAEQNVSLARNLGAGECRGEWLAFTDSDCLPPANWLEQASEILGRNNKLAVLGGPVLDHVPPGIDVPPGFQPQGWDQTHGPDERYLNSDEMHTECNMMIEKGVFREVGGFLEDLGPGNRRFGFHEGTELQARIRQRFGERGVPFYSPKITMLHVVRPGRMLWWSRLYRTFISGYDYARAFPQQGVSRAGLFARIFIQIVNFHWSLVFRPQASQRILFRVGEITGQAFLGGRWFPTHVRPPGSPVPNNSSVHVREPADSGNPKEKEEPSIFQARPSSKSSETGEINHEHVIFTSPKPFSLTTRDVQLTALRSWRHFLPACPIYLFGSDSTIAETCQREGVELVEGFPVSVGADKPILSQLFQKMNRDHPRATKIYLNSDIVLGPGVLDCLRNLSQLPAPWLASARRRCFPAFTGGAWNPVKIEELLIQHAQAWTWGPPWALDIFVYRGLELGGMPEFMIGHCAWDNWMIFNARDRGIMVVDCSTDLPIYHFDHGYGYSPGVPSRPERDALLDERNLQLLGGEAKRFHLGHATHEMRRGILQKKKGSPVWQRNLELWRLQHHRWEREIKILRSILHPVIRRWEQNTTAREHNFL